MQANPETMKTAQAAAAGFRAVGSQFRMSAVTDRFAQMRGGAACGFDASMSRREAAKILGASCIRSTHDANRVYPTRRPRRLAHPWRGPRWSLARTRVNLASTYLKRYPPFVSSVQV